jgi:hypothetical protein
MYICNSYLFSFFFLLNCVLLDSKGQSVSFLAPSTPCVAWVPHVELGDLGNSNSRASDVEPSPPRFARIKSGSGSKELFKQLKFNINCYCVSLKLE